MLEEHRVEEIVVDEAPPVVAEVVEPSAPTKVSAVAARKLELPQRTTKELLQTVFFRARSQL